nr:acyl-CoA dehydrogenase C-terminal domain-containing protein [bacterium]
YSAKSADDDDKKKAVREDSSDAKFYFNKIKTAQFFCSNILPDVFAKDFMFNTGDKSALEAMLEA